MKFKLLPMRNPQDRKSAPKFYAKPEYNGMIDIDFIAKQIAGRSSLTAGDIKSVLSNFLEEVPTFMLLGYSVKLNELGTFRISFSSKGVDVAADFRTTMINGLKVIYTPDVELKTRIEDAITYEQDKGKKNKDNAGGGEDEPEAPDPM